MIKNTSRYSDSYSPYRHRKQSSTQSGANYVIHKDNCLGNTRWCIAEGMQTVHKLQRTQSLAFIRNIEEHRRLVYGSAAAVFLNRRAATLYRAIVLLKKINKFTEPRSTTTALHGTHTACLAIVHLLRVKCKNRV
jgi:hypothetical protein